jgi:benzoyl-CoA reductase/2-hydroxyglutaryl-CoA dehydratase subunit BcrC/BadD/HgdB
VKSGVVGFTTTIPVEVIFAAGLTPCDLNNIFVTDPEPMRFIMMAEKDGFPKSMCNWIKGLYGVIMESKIDTVITVLEGDCSNTRALTEILRYKGITTISFSFPYDRDKQNLTREIEKLMSAFKVNEEAVRQAGADLRPIRQDLTRIDVLTWRQRVVTGRENHLWHVSASDMEGDYRVYGTRVRDFIKEAESRKPVTGSALGYVGVPPIIPDLYDFIEEVGCHVVYNETQRQFALSFDTNDITDRYLRYTYPYGIFVRLDDIKAEIKRRDLKGIIHYVQAFCYRAMEDLVLKESLGVPVITIEGDLPKSIDTRTKLRLEAFAEMLKGRQ